MLPWTEAQQVSLACLGHHTFQQPATGLVLWKNNRKAEDSSRNCLLLRAKTFVHLITKVRLVTNFRAEWRDTSPGTQKVVLDELGFPQCLGS